MAHELNSVMRIILVSCLDLQATQKGRKGLVKRVAGYTVSPR